MGSSSASSFALLALAALLLAAQPAAAWGRRDEPETVEKEDGKVFSFSKKIGPIDIRGAAAAWRPHDKPTATKETELEESNRLVSFSKTGKFCGKGHGEFSEAYKAGQYFGKCGKGCRKSCGTVKVKAECKKEDAPKAFHEQAFQVASAAAEGQSFPSEILLKSFPTEDILSEVLSEEASEGDSVVFGGFVHAYVMCRSTKKSSVGDVEGSFKGQYHVDCSAAVKKGKGAKKEGHKKEDFSLPGDEHLASHQFEDVSHLTPFDLGFDVINHSDVQACHEDKLEECDAGNEQPPGW